MKTTSTNIKKQKNIQVLYILTKLELGGAQKVCLTLMQGLKNSGGTPSLISGQEGQLVNDAKKFDSVFLLKKFKREVGIKSFFNEFILFFQLIKKMKTLKKKCPNLIVHTHSTKAGILGRWAALFAGVKKRVHTIHGFGFHKYQNKIAWIINYIFEFLTCIITTHYICVSKNDRNIGKKLLPKFWKKSSVINAAVEWDKFYIPAKKTTFIDSKKFVIGTTSCFKPQKNLFDLLKAFKLVCQNVGKKSENLLLQLVGDGILRKDIENWIQKNKMEKNIELLGWQNDVSKYMKNWNLFAMSSLWEGLPCAVVEARLSKLPVVAYKISGIPEVIFDNKNGFLVEAGNWQKLAAKIETTFLDNNLCQKMSNHKDNLQNFANKNMIAPHLRLYKHLVRLK